MMFARDKDVFWLNTCTIALLLYSLQKYHIDYFTERSKWSELISTSARLFCFFLFLWHLYHAQFWYRDLPHWYCHLFHFTPFVISKRMDDWLTEEFQPLMHYVASRKSVHQMLPGAVCSNNKKGNGVCKQSSHYLWIWHAWYILIEPSSIKLSWHAAHSWQTVIQWCISRSHKHYHLQCSQNA